MMTSQNENIFLEGEVFGPTSLPNKQLTSDRKHIVRKNALGEIKNVFHNQTSITPFKGLQVGSSKSFSTDFLLMQAENIKSQINNRQKFDQLQKEGDIATNNSDELNTHHLPTPSTCNEKCCKSLGEIWSEMNVLETDILKRILNGDSCNKNSCTEKSQDALYIKVDFDAPFNIQNPYEYEEIKFLQNLLAQDRAQFV